MTVVKHIGTKIGKNTFSCCIGRASVILASSLTASSKATSTKSTATVVPSTAHLDKSSGIMSMLRLTKNVGDELEPVTSCLIRYGSQKMLMMRLKPVTNFFKLGPQNKLFQTWNSIKLFLESRRMELNPRPTISKAT
jgi:hypothetical protein